MLVWRLGPAGASPRLPQRAACQQNLGMGLASSASAACVLSGRASQCEAIIYRFVTGPDSHTAGGAQLCLSTGTDS